MSALFLCVFVVLSSKALAGAELDRQCMLTPKQLASLQKERVGQVFDGDTLSVDWGGQKKSGPSIRLLGINTPETKKKKSPDEPYAQQALARLKQLAPSGQTIYVQSGSVGVDRYGRALAYVWLPTGENLSYLLIRRGLGHVVIFEDTTYAEKCLIPAQALAMKEKKGLWSGKGPWLSLANQQAQLKLGKYYSVEGRVTKREKTARNSILITLDNQLVLKITPKYLSRFKDSRLPEKGQIIRAKGWLVKYHPYKGEKSPVSKAILLRHPSAILMNH